MVIGLWTNIPPKYLSGVSLVCRHSGRGRDVYAHANQIRTTFKSQSKCRFFKHIPCEKIFFWFENGGYLDRSSINRRRYSSVDHILWRLLHGYIRSGKGWNSRQDLLTISLGSQPKNTFKKHKILKMAKIRVKCALWTFSVAGRFGTSTGVREILSGLVIPVITGQLFGLGYSCWFLGWEWLHFIRV